MAVQFRDTQVPLFIKIEKNIISDLENIISKENLNYTKPLFISSQHLVDLGYGQKNSVIVNNNSLLEAERITNLVRDHDLLIAIGGGQILDVGKYAATKAKINYISVPTTPSHDGIASPVAVLTDEKGLKQSLGVNMPTGIIVDLEVIKNAPLKNIQAGTGDLLSNFSALADWKLANKDNHEKMDDFSISLAYSAADLIYTNINEDKIDIRSYKFLRTLINGLILSGIAMHISGNSRPCSGAEHKISHAIDKLYPETAMHGEQVALGILIAEKLRDNDYANYKKLFKNIGLPTSYTDLNLTKEQMIEIILYAPQTRPDRYTILEKLNLNTQQINTIVDEL